MQSTKPNPASNKKKAKILCWNFGQTDEPPTMHGRVPCASSHSNQVVLGKMQGHTHDRSLKGVSILSRKDFHTLWQ